MQNNPNVGPQKDAAPTPPPETNLTKKEQTPSERFAAMVKKNYLAEAGGVELSEYQENLMQHLFLKVDMALADANATRKEGSTEITWKTIDMKKLALDAVDRIRMGIDGLIPGHLYPIAYWRKQKGAYDVDLRIGYKGEIFCYTQASLKPIKDLRVELVYSNDEFLMYKKGLTQELEGYDLKVTKPFDRGQVMGGFAYIEYEDSHDNVLVVMNKAAIDAVRQGAGNDKFWGPYYEEMAYKTLIHRAMKKVTIDPRKINARALYNTTRDLEDDFTDPPPLPQGANSTPLELKPDDYTVGEGQKGQEVGEGRGMVPPPDGEEVDPFNQGDDLAELEEDSPTVQQPVQNHPDNSAQKPRRKAPFA